MPSIRHVCSVSAILVVAPATTASADERWVAISTTAMAITGDITFAPDRIGFGATGLALLLVGTMRAPAVVGSATPMTLYRVRVPADPVLKTGNKLCGSGPVTYVGLWRPDGDTVQLAMFTGAAQPVGAETLCATYLYAPR